jgi:hypothetical protein
VVARVQPGVEPRRAALGGLKNRIDVADARIRRSLAALQAHVAVLVQRYTAETIASLTGYAYLVEAICIL